MAITFPTSLDALTNPSASTALDDLTIPHHQQHADANDAIEALETKVGIDGSADTASLDYKTANLGAGSYTPTLTGVTNVAASTAYACQWMRVRDVVTVSGKVDVDPTVVGSTKLGISLPIASNLSAAEQCAGVGASRGRRSFARRHRRAASGQPNVGLRQLSRGHGNDAHTSGESARAATDNSRVPDPQRTNQDSAVMSSRQRPPP